MCALSKIEKYDRRNARYKEQHKDDLLSEHGIKMRAYFENTTRESRSEVRAYRVAFEDIINDTMLKLKLDRRTVIGMYKDFFE